MVALGLAIAPAAHAEPSNDAALIWQAPDACPGVGEVRARIERRLGAPLDRVVRGVTVDVEVHDDAAAPRFVARIDLRGLLGVRHAVADREIRVLTSEQCNELADAVAIVIARIAAEREAPAGEVRLERPAVAPVVRVAPGPMAQPWGAGVRALAISGIGAQPGVAVGGEIAGYLRARSLVVELSRMSWLPGTHYLHAGGPARIDVRLGLTALRVGWGPERLPLRAWLAGELGSLRGEGIALEMPRTGSSRWLGAGAGFAVAWPMLQHARLVGAIEVVVPVQRARFVLQDGSEAYRSGRATVRSGLGLEIGWR